MDMYILYMYINMEIDTEMEMEMDTDMKMAWKHGHGHGNGRGDENRHTCTKKDSGLKRLCRNHTKKIFYQKSSKLNKNQIKLTCTLYTLGNSEFRLGSKARNSVQLLFSEFRGIPRNLLPIPMEARK